MTTTVAYNNKPTTPTDVAINFIDQSLLELRDSSFDPKTATYSAEYVLNSGTLLSSTTVFVLAQVKKDLSVFYSLKLRTNRTVTVDSVIVEDKPVDFNISWTAPSVQSDVADVLTMLGAAFGLLFNGVTTKVPNTGVISAMARALVGQLY